MIDFPDIPAFLRVENRTELTEEQQARLDERMAKVRPPRRTRHDFNVPKNIEPAGRALLREIQKEKAAKQAARLAMLKERRK